MTSLAELVTERSIIVCRNSDCMRPTTGAISCRIWFMFWAISVALRTGPPTGVSRSVIMALRMAWRSWSPLENETLKLAFVSSGCMLLMSAIITILRGPTRTVFGLSTPSSTAFHMPATAMSSDMSSILTISLSVFVSGSTLEPMPVA